MITYYTDVHDVDEDLRTIKYLGGGWSDGEVVGITLTDLRFDSIVHGAVASSTVEIFFELYGFS